MPSFIARVALSSASKRDYQELEKEMKKASFKDIRKSNHNKETLISPAEFNRQGHSLLEVTGAAAKAVRKTGKNYSFTVMKERKVSMH